jgi:hypothetical protein
MSAAKKGWQGTHRGFVRNVVVGTHMPERERAYNMPLDKRTREQDCAELDKIWTEGKAKALAFRAARRS